MIREIDVSIALKDELTLPPRRGGGLASLAFVAAIAFAAGVGAAAAKWRGNAEHWHRLPRMIALLAHAKQTPPGGVLVIGDSITEQTSFHTLCGRPAVNAGISHSTAADWLEDAPRLIEAFKPSLVVLALGTNDSGDWLDDYKQLARLAHFAVEPSDPAKAAKVRSVIRSVPATTKTLDGKHLSAEGAREWIFNVESACPR